MSNDDMTSPLALPDEPDGSRSATPDGQETAPSGWERAVPEGSAPESGGAQQPDAQGATGNVASAGPAGADSDETIGATGDAQDSALEKDPSEWVSGDDPMTESQKSYLDTLAKRAGEELPANLTKAQASEHIDRLRGQQGS